MKKVVLVGLIFVLMESLFVMTAKALEPPTLVPDNMVEAARLGDMSKTYAETTDPLDGKTYEFMITPSGKVIYSTDKLNWYYFGEQGYNIDSINEFVDINNPDTLPAPPIVIGKVDMIAADGNRIMVKTLNNDLYFASLVNGQIDLSKGTEDVLNYDFIKANTSESFFVTKAPSFSF